MNYANFEKEIYGNGGETVQSIYEKLEKLAGSKVKGSILWMVFGLLMTGITGFLFINSLMRGIIPVDIVGIIIIVAIVMELITVIAFSALTYKASAGALKAMFIFYSLLNGITLSVLAFTYEINIIINAFVGTVLLFTVLAIYGYVTKEDLSKYSSILKAGLIALILMGIVNIFLKSDGVMWISSILGVVIFIIFIAVDVNRIKNNVLYYAINEDMSIVDKIEIHGALSLYLDFINLFIYILRIIGKKR